MHSQSTSACDEYHEHLRRIQRRNFEGKIFYHLTEVISWMEQNAFNANSSNAERLVREVYANERTVFPPRVSKSHVPLFAVLLHEEIQCGHMFHIFQKEASQDFHLGLENLSDYCERTRLELENSRLKLPPGTALSDYGKVIEAFDRVRWTFSPVSLNLNTSFTVTHASAILPFCYREVINDKGGTASVCLHGIQEDLVEDRELRKALEPSKCSKENYGTCYQLAVKSYMKPMKAIYDIESEAFQGIRDQQGVVRYLGEYRLQHPTRDSPSHHIMLEYGEMDLDEYLAETYPPVLNEEIKKFWGELFSVARTLERIHNLQYDSRDVNRQGWHGDIKPDNILRVRGKYKLADFGFAKFERRRTGKTTTFLAGGTRTYGAPECDFSRYETRTPLSQTIDTWSFGCVLSSVATWVVLGSQAYENYNERRKIAIEALKNKKNTDERTSVPSCEDAFHDGKTVLPAVTDWHVYLRNSARRVDTTTHRVLDLVDKYMLVQNPEDRSVMGTLCAQLDDILLLSDHEYQQGLEKGALRTIRQETLDALQELDNQAPLRAIIGQDVGSEVNIRNNDGYGGLSRIEAVDDKTRRPNKQRKSERFEKIVLAKTANRVQQMPPLSESPIQLPEGADITGSDLPISRDGKRHEGIPILRLDSAGPPSIRNLSSTSELQQEPLEVLQYTTASPEDLSPRSPGIGSSRQLQSQSQGPIAMEHRGKTLQSSFKPSHENFNDGRPGNLDLTESVVVGMSETPPELSKTPIFHQHAALKRSWGEQKNWWRRLGRVPQDPRLKRFISNRDIVFVVDNAYSMVPHWDAVKRTLLALAMKVGSLDKDGLDLIYTCGDDKNVHAKGWDIPKVFEQSLDEARSIMNQKDKTDIQDMLTKRFDSHTAKGSQRQTLVILTDGLWEGSSDWECAETEIAKYICDLRKRLEKREKRWFTIQFISYGQNPKALERLQKLDDGLRGPDGKNVEDIVDTKPWYFENVDSLILGSINEAEDKETADFDKTGNDQVSASKFRDPSPTPSLQAVRDLGRRTSSRVSRFGKFIGKEREKS